MLPYLEEIARENAGIDNKGFLKVLALAQSFPGAMGINVAAIIGYRIGGLKGTIAGVLGVTIPGVLCASGLFYLLLTVAEASWFATGTKVLKAAVVGIILGMVVNLISRSWKKRGAILIGVAAALLFYQLQVSPILILLGAGLLGSLFLSPREGE